MPIPNLALEYSLWGMGYKFITGIDEVGRGSWAGPLVAAAVILPQSFKIPKVFGDSKQLRPKKRREIAGYIRKNSVSYSIAEIPVSIIDKVGVGKANQMAFRKVLRELKTKVDFILIDAFYIKHVSKRKQMAIKGGDQISASIAAASIIAKVYRDSLMKRLSKTYPLYKFAKHKGYGTKIHQEAIRVHGFTKIHRASYNLNFILENK